MAKSSRGKTDDRKRERPTGAARPKGGPIEVPKGPCDPEPPKRPPPPGPSGPWDRLGGPNPLDWLKLGRKKPKR